MFWEECAGLECTAVHPTMVLVAYETKAYWLEVSRVEWPPVARH